MRRNQVPASVVSIINKGGPNVQHKFSVVTAQERICWQFCVRLWSTAHTAGCLVVLRTFRWFSTITHWRRSLTNQSCAGYYNNTGITWPTTADLGRAPESSVLENWQHEAEVLMMMPEYPVIGIPARCLGGTQQHHKITQHVLKSHVTLGSSQHRPRQGSGQQSNLLQSAFSSVSFGESRRWGEGETVTALKSFFSLQYPKGNLMQMSRSFFVPFWNVIRALQLWARWRPLKRLG